VARAGKGRATAGGPKRRIHSGAKGGSNNIGRAFVRFVELIAR
jgi:hypothetical protein